MIQCVSLASGSKGNSFLIQFDHLNYLIDLGISYRRLRQALNILNFAPEAIHGIFITHEHIDHVSGLPMFLKHHPVPVFMTKGSAEALKTSGIPEHLIFSTPSFCRFKLGNLDVTILPTRHDAAESCAFQFTHEQGTLLHMTDTGEAPPALCHALGESDILVIESNHDETMLRTGPYPASLKARIAGPCGHLSNSQAQDLITRFASSRLRHVFLAHLSEHNNTPGLAQDGMKQILANTSSPLSFSPILTYPDRLSLPARLMP